MAGVERSASRATPTDPIGEWPDLGIAAQPSFPRIPAGRYQARTADLRTFVAFRRRILRLDVDVFRGEALNGVVLARLPLFFRLPDHGRPLSPSSKLARLYDLIVGPRVLRHDRLHLRVLRGKLLLVEVNDVTKDGEGRPLADHSRYSVVRAVLERLA